MFLYRSVYYNFYLYLRKKEKLFLIILIIMYKNLEVLLDLLINIFALFIYFKVIDNQ